jgi:membrane associated rhomboid family serine protease
MSPCFGGASARCPRRKEIARMIPIRDSIRTTSRPYVTVGLIVVNVLIFLAEWKGDMQTMIWKYGYVPAKMLTGREEFAEKLEKEHPPTRPVTDGYGRPLGDMYGRPLVQRDIAAIKAAEALPAWIGIFTGMFLHGGWMHLLGNMLYLWIFGNNIEDRLGPVLFFVFYIATGLAGNLLHTVFDASYAPLVGASGAISGVMGAYILLFPRARILAVVPVGWYPLTVSLPAWAFLGIYFLIQNLYPAYFTVVGVAANQGGVAYLAHVGGFASGMALIYILPHRKVPPVEQAPYDPDKDDADVVI